MTRVTKRKPCPVCNKPDWCMTGRDIAICMRVPSSRSKNFVDGSVGYIHNLAGFTPTPQPLIERRREQRVINIPALWKRMSVATPNYEIESLAKNLGVDSHALISIGCAKRDDNTYAFAMRDGSNAIIGIRLRTSDGRKFAVEGSHGGLFIPQMPARKRLYVVEGPTDTAAAVTIGLFAIGRQSCNGGVHQVVDYINRNKIISECVIVADTDIDRFSPTGSVYNPGISGAMGLMEHIPIKSIVVTFPHVKDMREFVKTGGDASLIESFVRSSAWRIPNQKHYGTQDESTGAKAAPENTTAG